MPRLSGVTVGVALGLVLSAFVAETKVGAFCWYGCGAPPCGVFITECGVVYEPVEMIWTRGVP
jgi:hypothetical protein